MQIGLARDAFEHHGNGFRQQVGGEGRGFACGSGCQFGGSRLDCAAVEVLHQGDHAEDDEDREYVRPNTQRGLTQPHLLQTEGNAAEQGGLRLLLPGRFRLRLRDRFSLRLGWRGMGTHQEGLDAWKTS